MNTESQNLNAQEETIDCWAYVEIFGHQQLAGRVQSRKFGTQIMLQIDVPKGEKELSHSELYSPNSIFSVKPTTEEWCRRWNKANQGASMILPYVPEMRSDLQLSAGGNLSSVLPLEDSDE